MAAAYGPDECRDASVGWHHTDAEIGPPVDHIRAVTIEGREPNADALRSLMPFRSSVVVWRLSSGHLGHRASTGAK